MKMKLLLLFLTGMSFCLHAHESDPARLDEMVPEEFWKYVEDHFEISSVEDFLEGETLEKNVWKLINSQIEYQSGVYKGAALRDVILFIGNDEKSTEYTVNETRRLLEAFLLKITKTFEEDRGGVYSDFRASDPFRGSGEDEPDGYGDYFSKLRFYKYVTSGLMNVLAKKGGQQDLRLLDDYAKIDDAKHSVNYSILGMVLKGELESRLKEDGGGVE